jgi:acetylornithine deacetylase/succinyl-diaminopimelate desuccinylase-like protein
MSVKFAPLTRRRFVGSATAIALSGALSNSASGMPASRATELARERRDELVGLVSDLVRIQSLSGETAAEAQSVVKSYLSALPYRIEESADRPSRYEDHVEFMPPNPPSDGPFINVVGWPTEGQGRRTAMFSHIDTHSRDEGWETDPLVPVLDGNRLYGLGTSDDKGGVAAMLVAASILAAEEEPLPVVMSLHGKGGGSRGSLPVFDRLSKTEHNMDAVLYVHPAETGCGLADIKNAVQGVVDLELSVVGWRAPPMEIGSVDSSDWSAGGNALDMCWSLLDHLRATTLDGVQFNLGIMNGGDRIGSVADNASARFRLKFTGDATWGGLLAKIRTAIDDFAGALGASDTSWQFSVDAAGYRTNPGAADWNAPVSRVLRDSIEDVTGRAPDAYPNHYAGDIRYPIRLLDVPAYGIGSIGGNFYGPNEWVDVDDLVNLVAVLVQTMAGWSDL